MVDREAPGNRTGSASGWRGKARRFHWKHWLLLALAIGVIGAAANLLGWNIPGWFQQLWNILSGLSAGYVLVAAALITLQTTAMAFAYLSILRFAYPTGPIRDREVFAAYAASVALNGVLPANVAPIVLMVMFTLIIPGASFAGVLAVYGVQKVFFVVAGAYPYLYVFLSVGGSFNRKFGFVETDPWATAMLLVCGVALTGLAAHLLWHRVAGWWRQAKEGGQILVHPRLYFPRVVLPELIAWIAGFAVIAVFFRAYHIPISFRALIRVVASNSIAGGTAVTPGAAGVTQAFNVASLHGITTPVNATAYSVAQQLVMTTWSIVYALALIVWAFGFSGGTQLLEESYTEARHEEHERRASREKPRHLKRRDR